ncbi:LPS export ABC transporter periplasmic protein LptC [Alphaproteobacteria bacterium]|nr:LPS export ABC transporter periplasmic protein LptC [Alphaproteobacteria bacterium]
MFLKNYLPRSEKIEAKSGLKYLKFALMFLFFCTILITFIFSVEDKNKMVLSKNNKKNNLNKNTITLENAKLIGNDRNNKPYVITAKSSFKNSLDENLLHLNSVEADMTLNSNNWMLINTNHAIFNIFEKTIKATTKVFIFYDDGTKLESSGLNYNVANGIGFSNSGVKMFGKWGVIEATSFSFDTNDHIIKFYNKPRLIFN